MNIFSMGVVFSPFCDGGSINIETNLNFTVESISIKTVHAFVIMLQQHDPEGAFRLLIACNYEQKVQFLIYLSQYFFAESTLHIAAYAINASRISYFAS